jgi:hypothetical protein
MNKEEYKAYHKAYREVNKEKIAEFQKAYYEANKEKIAEQIKAHYQANKEKILEQKKAYSEANKDKIAERKKAYYKTNRKKALKRAKAYRETNKEKILEQKKAYISQRKKSDPLFKLICNYRRSCHRAFKSIGNKKNNRSLKLLELETWKELAKHLESKFYDHPKTGEKMTLDNHGLYGWHIDHIIPISTAKTEEDIIKLCHYTNLQPLWVEDHIAKTASDLKKYKILDKQ